MPESRAKTYAVSLEVCNTSDIGMLMRQGDASSTHKPSTGIEQVYLGKQSILFRQLVNGLVQAPISQRPCVMPQNIVLNIILIPQVRLLCWLRKPWVDCQTVEQLECGFKLHDA